MEEELQGQWNHFPFCFCWYFALLPPLLPWFSFFLFFLSLFSFFYFFCFFCFFYLTVWDCFPLAPPDVLISVAPLVASPRENRSRTHRKYISIKESCLINTQWLIMIGSWAVCVCVCVCIHRSPPHVIQILFKIWPTNTNRKQTQPRKRQKNSLQSQTVIKSY